MPMVRAILDPDSLPVMGRRWDLATLVLLAAMLLFMPAAFGAVDAWSQLIVLAIAVALVLLVAVRTIVDAEFRPAFTWFYVPLALFIGLVVIQQIPLPIGLARVLAPTAVATRAELLNEATSATTTLSYYPRGTAEYLRLVLIGAAVFITVVSVVRRPRQIKELLLVIFVIGCVEAALALAQIATGARGIYWSFAWAPGMRTTSGTFVNYSHFCQFMNLSLGAGIAYFLIHLHELRREERHGSFRSGTFHRLNWEKHGWILCGIMLSAIVVFTSMSRNGAISLLVASAVVGTLLYRRGSLSWRGWILGLAPLGVLAVLLLFGFDAVYERMATLGDRSNFAGRWEMTVAALRAWWANPIWGTGLGTHEYVAPMFDTTVAADIAAHADNDYAELLEETGILGAALAAVFVFGMAALAARLVVRGRTAVAAGAFGLGYGLLAVAIHSATDFGQRVPAVFVLTSIFCGLLISIGRIEARDRLVRRGQAVPLDRGSFAARRTRGVAAAVMVMVAGGWLVTQAYAAFLAERWWAGALVIDASIRKDPQRADDQDYVDLLAAADSARRLDPTNISYGYWLNVYRWQSLSRVYDPAAAQVVLPEEAVPFVRQMADDLAGVRRLCPTYGPPYAVEGQLRLFVLGEPRGAELIRTGLRLAPYDPPTCLVAGELAAREGDAGAAESLLRRAVQLRPDYYPEVVQLYLAELQRADLARKLAGDDYWRLNVLANSVAQDREHAHLADELRSGAVDSLRRHAASDAANPRELAALASIDHRQGDFRSAVSLYRRALAQEYNQVDWRLHLAESLAAAGQIEEAIHEVRICLRLRPQYPAATALMNRLTTRPKSE